MTADPTAAATAYAPPTAVPTQLDLRPHLDNTGITRPDDLGAGAFNVWSNTFPAQHLPPADPDGTVDVGGVPFRFPAQLKGPDNLRCTGQRLDVPKDRYDWIYLLAAGERRTEDVLHLHFADGTADPEWLRVPDFWPQTPPHFGFTSGITFPVMHYPRHIQRDMSPSLWRVRVPVPREAELTGIHLPDNPAIHVFALTLCGPTARTEKQVV
ncbi:hypothetical protein ACIP4T_32860 [Streptomyces massasporeus]|uniref:hypothetical protein n=1 Tax=Streptomyces massasporeus TaxID=67324 RepID=UPI00368183F2